MTTLTPQVKQEEPLYSKKMDRYRNGQIKAVDELARMMPSFEKKELIHTLEEELYEKIFEVLKARGLDSTSSLPKLIKARGEVREIVCRTVANCFRENLQGDIDNPDIQSTESEKDSLRRFTLISEIAQFQALFFLEARL